MAPKIATPTALPAERANTLTPVTTPRSSQSTEACAAISVGAAVQPRPKPIDERDRGDGDRVRPRPGRASAMVPRRAIALPSRIVTRKPRRM